MNVLILGSGELASAVGHRLFRCGFRVIMTEIPQPLAVRRSVSFCPAVWQSQATVEGVTARFWQRIDHVPDHDDHIAVIVDPEAQSVAKFRPQVLIDARLLKRSGQTHINQAPLVISLGPGAQCGREAHVVIETHRGHCLGRIIEHGSATSNTGIPGTIGGFDIQRVLRIEQQGVMILCNDIGDKVQAGQVVATVGGYPVKSCISGVLRGILRHGTFASANIKLGDVDPRGDVSACFTISDKSRTISGSVLEAILVRYPVLCNLL